MVGVRQLLAAEVDHLVPEQRVPDLLRLRICQFPDIHAGDLRAHGRRQRLCRDAAILGRVVVELACGMKSHEGTAGFSSCNNVACVQDSFSIIGFGGNRASRRGASAHLAHELGFLPVRAVGSIDEREHGAQLSAGVEDGRGDGRKPEMVTPAANTTGSASATPLSRTSAARASSSRMRFFCAA